MGKIAFVFSGQGSQYPGMGESLYNCSDKAKELYDFAESYRKGTKEQSFNGTPEELKETKNTQPCLYLVDLCAALALNERGIYADAVAGFSLGEICALAYSGAYSYEDGFKIVTHRGEFMQKAAGKADTAMAAVLKLDSKTIEDVCSNFEHVYPVNYNCSAQTVVAGLKSELELFKEKISEFPCRVVDLPVGAGFHSPFMNEASDEFAEVLKSFDINKPEMPIYANYTALPYTENVAELMAMQLKSPVKWQETIENMINNEGIDTFIEVGAGKTLAGLIKKISKDVKVYNVEDEESLNKTLEEVGKDA